MPNMSTYCQRDAVTGLNLTLVMRVMSIISIPSAITIPGMVFFSMKKARPMPINSGTSIRPVARGAPIPMLPQMLPHENDTTNELNIQ